MSRADAYTVGSLITGSLLPVMLKLAVSVNIFEFLALTYLVALPFAFALVYAEHTAPSLRGYLRNTHALGLIILIAVLSYIPIEFSIIFAERYVSASAATVVFRTSPLLMLVFLPTLLKERLTWNQVLALFLGFIGVYVAVTNAGSIPLLSSPDLAIVLFLLVSALGYALATVLVKKVKYDLPSQLVIFNSSLLVIFLALYAATGAQYTQLDARSAVAMLYVGVFNNVAGFYMYFTGFRGVQSTFFANVFLASPFMTILLSYFILGDLISPYYLALAALVLAGLLMQRLGTGRDASARERDDPNTSISHRSTMQDDGRPTTTRSR